MTRSKRREIIPPYGLFSIKDLVAVTDLSARAIQRLIDEGDFPPPFMLGRFPRWRRRDIERFLLLKSLGAYSFTMSSDGVLKVAKPRGDIPVELAEIHSSLIEHTPAPCVYFLLQGARIVYVGQSLCLGARVVSHKRGSKQEEPKEFDRVLYLPVDASRLDTVEMHYIKLLKPFYNRAGIHNDD